MNTVELIIAIIAFVFTGTSALISFRQLAEKGFLFNNAYIYATKEERARMDKKPYYRQSAIVFCLVSAVFLVMGVSIILQNGKVQLLEIPLIIGALTYAIISSTTIERSKKK